MNTSYQTQLEKIVKNNGVISDLMVTLIVFPHIELLHLRSACMLAREAYSTEHQKTVEVERYKALALSAVVEAFAFIEGTVNTLLILLDNQDQSQNVLNKQDQIAQKQLSAMWQHGLLDRTPTLQKYDLLLKVCKLPAYDQGKQPYQSVQTLRLFRDYLVHYKLDPQLVGTTGKLELRMTNEKIKPAPTTGLVFPYNFLSHSSAEWAVYTALNFVDDFHKKLSVPTRYDRASLSTR